MRVEPKRLRYFQKVLARNRGLASRIAKELDIRHASVTGFLQGRGSSARIQEAIERHLRLLGLEGPSPKKARTLVQQKKSAAVPAAVATTRKPQQRRIAACFDEPADELVA